MNLQAYKDKYKDDRFFNEVFIDNHYNFDFTVMDVGALAGEFSFWISPFAKDVYALEPNSKAYDELENNIKEFGFNNVKSFKMALAVENGEGILNINGRGADTLGTTMADRTEVVVTKSLPSFISENGIKHIDIFKIDIENGEEEVFKAKGIEDSLKIIDLIIGEHLDTSQKLLLENGFEMTHLTHNKIFKKRK